LKSLYGSCIELAAFVFAGASSGLPFRPLGTSPKNKGGDAVASSFLTLLQNPAAQNQNPK
jgi:hypothetical protein